MYLETQTLYKRFLNTPAYVHPYNMLSNLEAERECRGDVFMVFISRAKYARYNSAP